MSLNGDYSDIRSMSSSSDKSKIHETVRSILFKLDVWLALDSRPREYFNFEKKKKTNKTLRIFLLFCFQERGSTGAKLELQKSV